jgi:hypothetical protein
MYKKLQDKQMHFGFIHAILLHGVGPHVSAANVITFRMLMHFIYICILVLTTLKTAT